MNKFARSLEFRHAPKRRSEAVYHALKRDILLRGLEPCAPLLEADLANGMGCSQGTVREALMRLQQDGLVTRRGYQGTSVSDTSSEEAVLLARLRLEIEGTVAAAAAKRKHVLGLRHLEEIVAAMREDDNRTDAYRLSELDQHFHRTILRMAGFESVEPILTRCMLHIYRHTLGDPIRRGELQRRGAADEHEALMRAIASGSAETAEAAGHRHIEDVIRRWSPEAWAEIAAG